MIKRILPIALLSATIIGNSGCNGGGDFKKLHGIEYKIVKDVKGKNAKIGDVIEFNIVAKVDTLDPVTKKMNSLEVANTYKQGRAPQDMVKEVKQGGQFQSVFPMLSAGDSAVVHVSCDTLLSTLTPEQRMRVPSWLKSGNKIVVTVSLISVKSEAEARKDQEAAQEKMQNEAKEHAAQQMPIDDKMLQEYFAKKNIKAQKTASGLYYTIEKPGTGAQITAGKIASMKYTGKTLDGQTFDSNVDEAIAQKNRHGMDPLKFTVGQGQMIPGVDEGAALLKKGSKATLYLPSPLAYGEHSPSGDIAPNSIMIFEVEVIDVTDAPAAGSMPKSMPVPKPTN